MKKNYDFSKMKKARPKSLEHLPEHAIKKLKKPVSLRMDDSVLEYFKERAEDTGVPYQTLMNIYLKRAVKKKDPIIE